MLRSLHIENIAVIKDAEIEFDSGFTVLTGETGAGKSMIIDGINLLLGSRASKEIIRTGADRASVTAMFSDIDKTALGSLAELDVFPDEDGNLFLSRSVTADNSDSTRSQSKINGHNISTSVARECSRILLDIHGQNDNQKLLDKSLHIGFLDAFAENGELLSEYGMLYSEMLSVAGKIKELHKNENEREYRLSRAKAENSEIDAAKLKSGEEEKLNERRVAVADSEKIAKHATLICKALSNNEKGVTAEYLIERASVAMSMLEGVIPDAAELSKRLSDIRYELEDIAERADSLLPDGDTDPVKALEEIDNRLDVISRLTRKYNTDVEGILELRQKNAELIANLENSGNIEAELMKEFNSIRSKALTIAEKLTARRKEAGGKIEEMILGTLRYLDMPNVRFSSGISLKKGDDGRVKLGRDGEDEVEFLISTNPGEPLLPLSKIASGGELARIMLSLKSVLADKAGTGTVIYDEVDTGISGATSGKLGIKLRAISEFSQIICVTHSAQIAACANRHCLISKSEVDGRAETGVKILDEDGRVRELARIMGGIDLTEKTMEAARELLNAGNGR